jgi:hypothetical protein
MLLYNYKMGNNFTCTHCEFFSSRKVCSSQDLMVILMLYVWTMLSYIA